MINYYNSKANSCEFHSLEVKSSAAVIIVALFFAGTESEASIRSTIANVLVPVLLKTGHIITRF